MSNNGSSHWCKGVLDEVQAKTSQNPSSSPLAFQSYQSYPYLQGFSQQYAPSAPPAAPTPQPPRPSIAMAAAVPAAQGTLSPNEYYRQYYDYYTRYFYAQNQTAQATPQSSSQLPQNPQTPTPMPTQTQPPPPPPPVASTTSALTSLAAPTADSTSTLSYSPPANSNMQTTYSSAPISYAAAVIKGQSTWSAPAPVSVSTAQPQKKPNPSRFTQAHVPVPVPPPPSHPRPTPPPTPISAAPGAHAQSATSYYGPNPSVPPTSNPPQSSTSSSSSSSPWPPTLKLFVEKSFSQCVTDADRSYIEDKLKSLISKVSSDGRMNKHRWEMEPIPIPPSQQQQQQQPEQQVSASTTSSNTSHSSKHSAVGTRDEVKEPRRKKSRFQPVEETSTEQTPTPQSNKIVPATVTSKEEINRQNRANRFLREHKIQNQQSHKKKSHVQQNTPSTTPAVSLSREGYSDSDLESFVVIGTSRKVEKDYFRLTSAPDPATVRPLEILQKAFELVKERWNQSRLDQNNKNHGEAGGGSGSVGVVGESTNGGGGASSGGGSGTSYVWLCSQLKSLRQDVMVQHIKTEFTVNVYELHGRIALQCGDLNEYNQCQTQLKQLYSSGLPGSEMEFTAYRILYYLYLQGNSKYQKGNQDIVHIMSSLSQQAMSDPAVQHALQLRKAISLDNYHHFFRLYRLTPNLGRYIVEKMIDSWRIKALQRMIKTYRPTLEIEFILSELSFDPPPSSSSSSSSSSPPSSSSLSSPPPPSSSASSSSSSPVFSQEGIEFLTRVGGIISTTESGIQILDLKTSIITSTIVTQEDQLLL